MPISPVIANTVEVRLLWSLQAQGAINVLHATAGSGTLVSQSMANALGAAIKSAYTANLAPLQPSNSILARVGVRDLRTANQAEFLDNGTGVVGSAVEQPLPPQTALCLTLRTALSGKSYRGRVYLGGFGEAQSDINAQAVTGASTGAVSFLTAVSNAMTASGLTFAVASRPSERFTIVKTTFHNDGTTTVKQLTKSEARGGGSQAVTNITARNATWETQRRRMNGRSAPATTFAAVASHDL